MITELTIENIVNEHFNSEEFFLVEVIIKANNRILVFFEKKEGLVGINDCVALSKYIESRLNRDEEDFELEVSSAGIESSFKVLQQYIKHKGKEVSILKKDGIKLQGLLGDTNEDEISLDATEKVKSEKTGKKELVQKRIQIPINQIKETKRIFKF